MYKSEFLKGEYMFYAIKIKKFLIIALGVICVGVVGISCTKFIINSAFNDKKDANILIIDPGHGGADGGAVSGSGVIEKDINLSISTKLNLLSGFLGYDSIMTRESDISIGYDASKSLRQNKVFDMHKRAELVNQYSNPVFISIHQNKFPAEKYKGAQVFYSGNNNDSEILASELQKGFARIDVSNKRIHKKASDDLYLMKTIKCPAVIVETGFLSNNEETLKLLDNSYQNDIALTVLSAYVNFI